MIIDSDDEEGGVKGEEADRDAEWDDERAREWICMKVEISFPLFPLRFPTGLGSGRPPHPDHHMSGAGRKQGGAECTFKEHAGPDRADRRRKRGLSWR